MASILQNGAIDKLPVAELSVTLDLFLEPVLMHLPEKRLEAVGKLAVQGVLGGQSPLVTQMARGVAREDETVWPTAKRLYRFVWNPRFNHSIPSSPARNIPTELDSGHMGRRVALYAVSAEHRTLAGSG